MGMDISAKLMYGLWYKDIVENLDDEAVDKLHEDIDSGIVDTASPWYDSEPRFWFIGFEMCEYIDVDGLSEFEKELNKCEGEFIKLFGKSGYMISVPDVY